MKHLCRLLKLTHIRAMAVAVAIVVLVFMVCILIWLLVRVFWNSLLNSRAGSNEPARVVQKRLAVTLLHQFDLTWPPGLINPRLLRAVHAQNYQPALAGDRL